MQDYIYTDLAYEETEEGLRRSLGENLFRKNIQQELKVVKFEIKTKEEEERYRKGRGRYVTMMTPYLASLEEETYFRLEARLGAELRELIDQSLPGSSCKEIPTLMAVGLGNAEMTADSLGPETIKQVTATRHLMKMCQQRDHPRIPISVCCMIPGVLGSTGMETVESVLGAVDRIKPDLVLAVDALSARHISRLAATVQITDAGISPGSGIGNLQKALTEKTLGVPVIALGVPMVVNSSTMIRDALEQGGITSLSDEMRAILDNGRSFFVTPKDSDVIVKSVSMLLAGAIDRACMEDE